MVPSPGVLAPAQINIGRRTLLQLAIHSLIRISLIGGPFVLAAWLAGPPLPNAISTPEVSSRTVQSQPGAVQSQQEVVTGEAAVDWPISSGERSLIPILVTPQKQAAIAAFKTGDYGRATEILTAYLEANCNDPEA